MRTVILCGGKGTRLAEETRIIPKPMVKIGNKPILWHILKIFNKFGLKDFILATGYKKKKIEQNLKLFKHFGKVKCIDTGSETLTGGRLLRLKDELKSEENFLMTYGDGVSDININKLISFHYKKKKIATLTAVRPPVRFGELTLRNFQVQKFQEKPQAKAGWINGGFFVLNKKVFKFLKNDQTIFERSPLESIAKKKQLVAYKHEKFWQCMDKLRDKELMNKLFYKGEAPWLK